jgi:hypothetical protein
MFWDNESLSVLEIGLSISDKFFEHAINNDPEQD